MLPSFAPARPAAGYLLAFLLAMAISAQAQPTMTSPTWQWVQPLQPPGLGGTLDVAGLTRDRRGDLFLTGVFTGSVLLGDVWLRGQEGQLAFVARLAPDGRCRWASALPTPTGRQSAGESIAADGTGHVWVSGIMPQAGRAVAHYRGPESWFPQEGVLLESGPNHFVARLDSVGRWQWQQPVLLTGQLSRVGADARGYGYVNGGAPATGPAATTPPLASRLDADGHWGWTVPAGPGQPSGSVALAVGPGGELYLAGQMPRPKPTQPATRRPAKPTAPLITPLFQGVVLALHPDGHRLWQVLVPEASSIRALSIGPVGGVVAAGELESPVSTRFYSDRRALRTSLVSREVVVTSLSATGQRHWNARAAAQGTYYAGPGLYAESTLAAREVSVGPDGHVWLTCMLKGSATFASTTPISLSSSHDNGRAPDLLLAHLDGLGRWRGVSKRTRRYGGPGNWTVAAGEGLAYLLQTQGGQQSFDAQQEVDSPLFSVTAAQSDHWQPLLRVDCGRTESALSTVAPLPGTRGWAVTGQFANVSRAPGGGREASSDGDVLMGQLADNGSWRWLRAGGLSQQAGYAQVSAAATDSSGRLLVTGQYRRPFAGEPTGTPGSLGALLGGALPPSNSSESLGFVGQVDQAGQWRWAHYLAGISSENGRGVAVAPAGNSWLAYSRPAARDTSSWGSNGDEVVLQERDADGRLTTERILGKGNLRYIQLARGPGSSWYLTGEVADSLVLVTAHGRAYFRPLPAAEQQQYEQVLIRVSSNGTVNWVRSLGRSLSVRTLAPALAGELWVAATLDADTVVVATQPPSRFQRLVQGNQSYLLGRLDSTGTWRWAKQVEESNPVIAPDTGDQLVVHGLVVGEPYVFPPADTTKPAPPSRIFLNHLSAQGKVLTTWSPEEVLPGQTISALSVTPAGDLLLVGTHTRANYGEVGFAARLRPAALAAPLVLQFAPRRLAGGATLRITGVNLEQVRQVLLNKVPANFETLSETLLHVRVPFGLPPGKVRVMVRTGTTSVVAPNQLRVR